MNTPSEMNIDWNTVNLSFTPTAADLAGGSRGTDIPGLG